MPEVGIFPSYQSNAFATGWNKNAALVAVSSGLLDRMSRDEVKGGARPRDRPRRQWRHGDTEPDPGRGQHLCDVLLAHHRQLRGSCRVQERSDGPGIAYFVTSIIADILLGILASTIVMWFSRRREFRADEAGAVWPASSR
jgi:heat shock protein HtpX